MKLTERNLSDYLSSKLHTPSTNDLFLSYAFRNMNMIDAQSLLNLPLDIIGIAPISDSTLIRGVNCHHLDLVSTKEFVLFNSKPKAPNASKVEPPNANEAKEVKKKPEKKDNSDSGEEEGEEEDEEEEEEEEEEEDKDKDKDKNKGKNTYAYINFHREWACPLCNASMKINEIYCDEEVKEAKEAVKDLLTTIKADSKVKCLLVYKRENPKIATIVNSHQFLREINKHSYMLNLDILSLLPFSYPEKLNILEVNKPSVKYIEGNKVQLYFPITTQIKKTSE